MTVQELLDAIATATLDAGLDAQVRAQIVKKGGGAYATRDSIDQARVLVIALPELTA